MTRGGRGQAEAMQAPEQICCNCLMYDQWVIRPTTPRTSSAQNNALVDPCCHHCRLS